jgi:hypothetical protein
MKSPLTTSFAKIAGLTLGASLIATLAIAQEGPNLRTMQCSEAKAEVNTKGAVILNSGPNIFNRYVKDRAYCPEDMYLRGAFVRTENSRSCFIGYTCNDKDGD